MGANAIKADGNILIGANSNPQTGPQLAVKSTCYAVYAGGTISVNGSALTLGVIDTSGKYVAAA